MADSALLKYPRPSVAVDVALLTVVAGRLSVALIRRDAGSKAGELSLPGTFLHEGERLADAVIRCLKTKAGMDGRSPRQLHVFDDPQRDDRGWVLSVAHLDVLPFADLAPALDDGRAELATVDKPLGLPYGHDEIVGFAVEEVRAVYAESPDPWGLVQEPFTMSQLRAAHESVAGTALQRDTFRRRMEPQLSKTDLKAVPPSSEPSLSSRGRPARLFRRP